MPPLPWRRPPPPPDALWREVTEAVVVLRALPPGRLARLRALSARFLARKTVVGAGGQEVDEALRLAIAAQACLPVLELGLEAYRGWWEVVVYPGAFVSVQRWVDEAGVEHELRRPLTGESWPQGPVILSETDVWSGAQALDGYNVVIHEMAHKLDLLNGEANGFPPLHRDMDRRAWTSALAEAFEDLRRRTAAGEAAPLDPYAAEDPGEFFACATEAFFEVPGLLAQSYPAVYAQLRAYYRQDPLSWSWMGTGGRGSGAGAGDPGEAP